MSRGYWIEQLDVTATRPKIIAIAALHSERGMRSSVPSRSGLPWASGLCDGPDVEAKHLLEAEVLPAIQA